MLRAYSCAFAIVGLTALPTNVQSQSAQQRPRIIPLPVFITEGNGLPLDDTSARGAGVYMSPGGATLFFCSVNGCYPGRHLAAQVLINMQTKIDATAQEVGLFVNATSRTGAVLRWRPKTDYQKGAEVQSANGYLFQAMTSGKTGTIAPTAQSTGLDGGVDWRPLSDVVHNGKTALGAGLNMVPGSGQGWSLATDLTVQPGVGDQNAFGYENDCANYNKDSDFGVPFLRTCFFQGGQGKGTKPMFSYRYVAAGDGSTFGAHYGDFFNGGNTVKDATIADATNAINTIRVLPGSKHDSVFMDASTSRLSIEIEGSYASAIDLSNAHVRDSQVKGRGWHIAPDGTVTAVGFITTGATPHTSVDQCRTGNVRFGENYIYVCVSTNKWKRSVLENW